MLTFEKGSPDRVAGKGVIYAYNCSGEAESLTKPLIIAGYVAADPLGMYAIMEALDGPVPPEARKLLERIYRRKQEQSSRQRRASVNHFRDIDPEHAGDLADKRFSGCLSISNTFDVEQYKEKNVPGDLVRATDIPGITYGASIIGTAASLYVATFHAQQRLRPAAYQSPLKRYTDLSPEELRSTIQSLVAEVFRDAERDSFAGRAAADLRRVASQSLFAADVEAFCRLARNENPDRLLLMTLYMQKVFAIIDEDFPGAAKARDEIRALEMK